MNGQQIEGSGRAAVKSRAALGFLPILLEMAIPETRLALLDKKVITILNGGQAASHTLGGGGSANNFYFPGASTQRVYPAQAPQPIIEEKILPGFEQ